ncbi:sterol desaturase family protein [Sorangium atrum]|uniref:Sterol desaturase family protein n=1 Tax=Sorangium atrum TaxID=2995308 RepID=A0ABT5CFB7_9BACT|nr:sterol desaturase family protein [Sorangium aterium]MDC0684479.1 sterol desaturase family protein [Sorangium aterium]
MEEAPDLSIHRMRGTLIWMTSRLLYPLLLAVTLYIIYAAVTQGWDLRRALWGYLFGLIVLLITVERLLPLSPDWGMTRQSFWRDLKYLLASGVTIAMVRTGFGTLALWLSERHQGPLASASVLLSVGVFLVVFELLQYWFHRLSHEGTGALGRFLWKVHLAHHLPDRVYVVMHGVFHPLNALISAVLIQSTLLILGLSPQAVFAAVLLIDLQTMGSHFNVDIRAGFLNYVFIGTELHRYHHSADIDEARNFGTVLPLWDLVFGTFVYRPDAAPRRLGVDRSAGYPPSQQFWQVLALPFRR